MFNKWDTFKKEFHSKDSNKRPLLATECDSLTQAEKFRRDIIRDVTKNISAIQNASLGEHRVRELNDTINKLMRQKHFWDTRVKELGGTLPTGKQLYDVEGKALPGAPFYKYYGAAKNLPGIRELFGEKDEEREKKRQKRTRKDIFKNITPDYYGYRDDDDGILAAKEAVVERALIAQAEEEFLRRKFELVQRIKAGNDVEATLELSRMENLDGDDDEQAEIEVVPLMMSKGADSVRDDGESSSSEINSKGKNKDVSVTTNSALKAHVALPSQQEMADLIMQQRKQQLLESMNL